MLSDNMLVRQTIIVPLPAWAGESVATTDEQPCRLQVIVPTSTAVIPRHDREPARLDALPRPSSRSPSHVYATLGN